MVEERTTSSSCRRSTKQGASGASSTRCLREVDEIVVVDDASRDATQPTSHARRATRASRVLTHAVNRGVGAAIATGYRDALAGGGEPARCFVVMAGDAQIEPADLPAVDRSDHARPGRLREGQPLRSPRDRTDDAARARPRRARLLAAHVARHRTGRPRFPVWLHGHVARSVHADSISTVYGHATAIPTTSWPARRTRHRDRRGLRTPGLRRRRERTSLLALRPHRTARRARVGPPGHGAAPQR